MDSSMSRLFYNVGEKIVDYLPNVFGAALLLLAGWALAWLAKRITVQVCFLLRPDRLLRRFRWGAGFSKADLRYALFNSIGSVAFALVFLAFLTTALVSLRLTVLSGLIEKGVLFLPKALVALLIVGTGSLIAARAAAAIERALVTEEVPRATLAARFAKGVLLLFFSSMALVELDIARQIVVIGFTVAIVTLGAMAVVVSARGGRGFVTRLMGGRQTGETFAAPNKAGAAPPARRQRSAGRE
jgi:hypothetical protein